MDDRDLLAFLADVQLQCGKNHACSDLVLHALEQFRKGEITEKYCCDLIKTLLRPYPEMLERFSVIIEDSPPPNSRTGCIVDEPFINTSIEFELWPGALGRFLRKSRRAILKQCSIDDVFVVLEHIKDNTSGPFWLLWELYEPILPNSSFMQAIYDGCIGQETIPINYEMPSKPSDSDKDPTSAVPDKIIDSDLVCCYSSDCRNPSRPLGLLKHGSYGLLDRKIVNIHCSGRTPRDFAVLNDRWATAASGSEGQFQPAQKNQYEERLFLMEDERVFLDVKICRLKKGLERLQKLKLDIEKGEVKLNPDTFPRGILNSLDVLSLRELYADYLPNLLKKIVEQPSEMITIVINRITERLSTLEECRRNKESDYHDLNKKNYSRSLEVRHEEKQQQYQVAQPVLPNELKFDIDFQIDAAKSTFELISKTYKLGNNKDSNITSLLEFILSTLAICEPTPLQRHLRFSGYPSITTIDSLKERVLILSTELTNLFQLFARISAIIEKILNAQPPPQQHSGDVIGARGIQLAVAIGNVSASIFQPNFAQDAISDSIPNYIVNGRHNPALESLFEMPSNLAPGSLEMLKKSVQQFIKTAQNAFLEENTQLFIDAVKCEDDRMYNAIVLEKLSGTTFYTAKVFEQDERKMMEFNIQIPRVARTKHSVKLFFNPEFGPGALDEVAHDEQQNKILTGRYSTTAKAARRTTMGRPGFTNMKFRLSSNSIEFASAAHTTMLRK
ncbi:hypothetical protein TRFO_12717 [Tritrichomonas foetus]|uniref:Histone deacetylase interacting domain-containing protein n=1 Tax=Tritrichomonas foetus TaxID=1144522 RepID=A0A1J4L510_9EUKA|nr:hypothetical protein TRFO_12717 [Tritrichomonas foetus]|eukprot:OHT17021.1 hypothetical protein TRFO_12717 [Tritrichomonas foetus]